MAKIENHRYTVAGAFQECFYVIPDYQREYVWTEKEVQQLLDDIDEQMDADSNKEYFVGMILVSQGAHRDQFEVIDGQQRLTTFYLLLCAMRHLMNGTAQASAISGRICADYTTMDGETSTTLKLDPRYENASELMRCLVEQNDEPGKVRTAVQAQGIKKFGSLESLLDAYTTIYRSLQNNYQSPESLKKLWGYLSNKVIFFQILADVSTALKIFETINERGVGLNPMDLLKNLLFTQVKPEEFTKLKSEWKKITSALEKAKEKPLRFLRYYIMANFKCTGKDSTVHEDEIYDWFVKPENAKLCGYRDKPFQFVRQLILNAENYVAYSEGRGNDGQPSIAMANLKRMCGGAFSLHFILLLAASELPKDLFNHFVSQLESFLFYYIYTKTPTKELERNFYQWAEELREISKVENLAEQKSLLNNFVLSKLKASMVEKENELIDALKRYSSKSMQKYRTRYLLAKLTQYVDMAFSGFSTPGLLDDYMKLEIEHILPNSPTTELREKFEKKSGANYDEYKEKLGNFTLLEKPHNIVAGNSFFADKKDEYINSQHYLTKSIVQIVDVGKHSSVTRINDKLLSFDTWDAFSIDKRQDKLIELAMEVWNTTPIQ